MIIQLTGKVKFPLTLDCSVWIFDDRKIIFEDAFSPNKLKENDENKKKKQEEKVKEMYSLEMYQQKIKPPVNRNLNKYEQEEILQSTYVMPIKPFIENAEIESNASSAILHTEKSNVEISLKQFTDSYLLFAKEGKPIKDEGPVHLYFKDGSNRDNPIKGIKKITIQ